MFLGPELTTATKPRSSTRPRAIPCAPSQQTALHPRTVLGLEPTMLETLLNSTSRHPTLCGESLVAYQLLVDHFDKGRYAVAFSLLST